MIPTLLCLVARGKKTGVPEGGGSGWAGREKGVSPEWQAWKER